MYRFIPRARRAGHTSIAGLIAALSLAAAPTTGTAATVTYSTSGSELCIGAAGCGALSQIIGDVQIRFDPVASMSVTAAPTTFSVFGGLVMSCVGGGTACGSQSLDGLNLYIDIDQTGPNAGGGVLAGAFSGAMSGSSSSAKLAFGAPAVIGTTTYAAAFNPLAIVPASVNAGGTSLQARITYAEPPPPTTVPEPGAWALMIAGFGAAGTALRRRRLAGA